MGIAGGVLLLWWRVDPCCGGQGMWLGVSVLKPLGVQEERSIQCGLAIDQHGAGVTVVHAVRRHVADARMPVHVVVPRQEAFQQGPHHLKNSQSTSSTISMVHEARRNYMGVHLFFG